MSRGITRRAAIGSTIAAGIAGSRIVGAKDAKMSAEEGVFSEGFRIIVQPAASAGATLQAI